MDFITKADPIGRRGRPLLVSSALLALAGTALWTPLEAARQDPVPAAPTLAEDASAARVLDREGNALRKPLLAQRWTTADAHDPVEPGEWLRTGTRGANALALRLACGAEIVLGPGTQLELTGSASLRLERGELEVQASGGAAVTVDGPGEMQVEVSERAVLRASSGALRSLPKDPRWLTGYRNNASTEALGSLLANVDGRNLPLTIGYHKVSVDIRDQIARTVVEESFRNHTSSVLEGTFYFPLPADASISSFGMWIGDEFVEGEIVEKQRAREIYETILRERRDPGLLEWSGGNLFKARVFPIHAEKRIKLSYTQVLPKRNGAYVYRYGLRSEMLQKNPLEKLQIEVSVHSEEPLASVASPSHECRVRTTDNSATVELFEEEYTPDADFELRIDAGGQEPLRFVPHRRGDDGYFAVLFDAPATDGERAAVGEPLHLLLMADTSGSMHGPARSEQISFLEAMLASLGPEDRFNLLTCDVETRWAFETPVANTEENREHALRFVEKRDPLGWTDLDQAFQAAARRAADGAHVVYVGDGVTTIGDADPAAFARRLARYYEGSGTFHAVMPGASYERIALRGVASLGGGSMRAIGGSTDPARAARELLDEITRPGIRDLEIAFEGLGVAGVHPAELRNLPLGTQQIVVGRFDPLRVGEAQVVVRGTFAGDPVEFRAPVTRLEPGGGNSFVPRLWARRQLDYLLEQGSTEDLQAQIVGLSEEFQIITPYTSFLVLESDEDRERFQIEKRFRMRDGEEFFAQGRDNARYELLREQMLAAKRWRMGLQAEALAMLSAMDRHLTEMLASSSLRTQTAAGLGWGGDGELYGSRLGESRVRSFEDGFERKELASQSDYGLPESAAPAGEPMLEELGYVDVQDELADRRDAEEGDVALREAEEAPVERMAQKLAMDYPASRPAASPRNGKGLLSSSLGGRMARNEAAYWGSYDPFEALLPAIGPPRSATPEWSWPAEVQEVVASLDRRAWLRSMEGRVQIEIRQSHIDRRGRHWDGGRALYQDEPHRWLAITGLVSGADYRVEGLNEGQRFAYGGAWHLGRTRSASEADRHAWPAPFPWYFGDRIGGFAGYEAARSDAEDGTTTLTFRDPNHPDRAQVLVVDLARGAVLESRWEVAGETTSQQRFSNLVEVAGAWWPSSIVAMRPGATESTTIEVIVSQQHDLPEEFAAALPQDRELLLLSPQPADLAAAKQAAAGEPKLEDSWRLLRHYTSLQRWDEAGRQLSAILGHASGKRSETVLRLAWLQISRRHEELKGALHDAAQWVAQEPRSADFAVAQQIVGFSGSLNTGNERLQILELLAPVYERQPEGRSADWSWAEARVAALQNMGRTEKVFQLRSAMATEHPTQASAHTQYAQLLAQRGEYDQALEVLYLAESGHGPWSEWEIQQFRQVTAGILWDSYRLARFVSTVETWWAEDPASRQEHSLCDRYLSALVMLDREAKAGEITRRWLELSAKAELDATEQAQLRAAIQHCLGNGYQMYRGHIEPQQADWLTETFPRLADHPSQSAHAQWILTHWQFRRLQQGRDLASQLFVRVTGEAGTLPAGKVQEFVNWLQSVSYLPEEGMPAWERLFADLLARWSASEDQAEREPLAGCLLAYADLDTKLAVRRQLFEEAEAGSARQQAAAELFAALLQAPWATETQEELVSLLGEIGAPRETPSDASQAGRDSRIVALYRWVTWMVAARSEAALAALPGRNELPRRRLMAATAEARRMARASAAARLAELERTLEDDELREWAKLDRQFLAVRARQDLDELFKEILADAATQLGREGYAQDPQLRTLVLASRRSATLSYLLTLLPADARAEAAQRLLSFYSAGLGTESSLLDWRAATHTLLLALDRPADLAERLAEWYGDGTSFSKMRWGRAHAYLQAELGHLAEAAQLLEELAQQDELGHRGFRALAGWYTALDQRDAAQEARLRSWEVLGEAGIADALRRDQNLYARRGDAIPPDLDPEVALRVVAILRKASYPANYLWQVRNVYASTKDFRLLQGLPEAVIGRSSQEIYPFLGQLLSITDMLQDEASLDQLQRHLATLAEQPANAADRRALVLLRYIAARRAAEQAQGAGPHVETCLAALREAFQGTWEEGEPWLYASFHGQHLAATPAELISEQLAQLRQLAALPGLHAEDRFRIADVLAQALWNAGERQEAVDSLVAALEELRTGPSAGMLPSIADESVVRLSGFFCDLGRFAHAETVWERLLEAGYPALRSHTMRHRLFQVYLRALQAGGEVSFGSGDELYAGARDRMTAALRRRSNENQSEIYVTDLCNLFKTARRTLPHADPARDAASFAFEELPGVLALYQYRNGQDMVQEVERCLRDIASNLVALEFLVTRAENEPSWLRLQGQDFWGRHAWSLSHLRSQTPNLPMALQDRVLGIVLRELRRDLRSGQARSRLVYHSHNSEYWAEKEPTFLKTARRILDEVRDSEVLTLHVADYLYHGVSRPDLAIEALQESHARELLGIGGRDVLAQYLHWQKRWAESVPVLEGLVEDRPDTMDYRARLLRGLFGSGALERLEPTRTSAESWFQERGLWNEANIAVLADGCVDSQLDEAAVRHFAEAVALHVKTAPNRGVGDGVLSRYYRNQSLALVRLGRTADAVDAAAGAVVSWGRSRHERQDDLQRLQEILNQASDLEAYVARFESEVDQTGLENPILRKALGQVYLDRREYQKSAGQLARVVQAAPHDLEAQRLLTQALDKSGERDRARGQMLVAARMAGHELGPWEEYGWRMERDLGEQAAERAFTQLVELFPHESQGRQALAGIREQQERWEEAQIEWRQVIRIRTQEPTGYLGLARTMLHLGEWEEASSVLQQVLQTAWPEHFGDVHRTAQALLNQAESHS